MGTTVTAHASTNFNMPTGSVLRYMRFNGHDTNCNGTVNVDDSAGVRPNCAWKTPNHAMKCGEVVVATSVGTYTSSFSQWGTVSNCPSTSGGIDGTGGINAAILLCGGPDVTSCVINCAGGSPCKPDHFGPQAGFSMNKSNWAVEGWTVNGGNIAFSTAYQATGCSSVTHHIYIINTVTYNVGQSFQPNDCATVFGGDYVRIVGMIAENAVLDSQGICIAAIDVVAPGKYGSSTTDVHYFIYNNFAYNNLNNGCDTVPNQSDAHNFMFDSIGKHAVIGRYVLANNIGAYAHRACINNFFSGSLPALTLREYNNTCYNNNQRGSMPRETWGTSIIQRADARGASINIFNNIVQQPNATNQYGHPTLALFSNGSTTTKIGAQYAAGAENILMAASRTCPGGTCNSGPPYIQGQDNGANYGTNILVNPDFKNGPDITNHLNTPNCTGYLLTTQCMGWDATTQTAVSSSIIDDLTPNANGNCPQCAGKGYQRPRAGCIQSSGESGFYAELYNDYPPDLKGLVTLHWDGAKVIQIAGLADVPCGM
jgi:hypothetical protein